MGYKWVKTIMKKITLVAIALVCSVAFTNCAAKKPVNQKSAAEAEIERLKLEKEKRDLIAAMEEDSIRRAHAREDEEAARQRQKELDDAKQELKIANMNMQERLEEGMKMLLIPCSEEALINENSENMSAMGIATNQPSEEVAMLNANRTALSEITTRFLGVMKNGIEQYSKDTQAKSGNRGIEAQLEGLAIAIGEKEENKQFKVACRKFTKTRVGNYNCYVALYVPVEKMLDAYLDKAEEAGIDLDKALFRKHMQAELDRQSEKKQAENKQMLENMQAAREEMEK